MTKEYDRLALEFQRINRRVDKEFAFLRNAGTGDIGRAARIMLRCCDGHTDPRIKAGLQRLAEQGAV